MRGFSSLFCDNGPEKPCTAVLQNLAKKIANPHAQNFPFIFNVKLHACAKIDVGIFCKIL